MTRHKSWRVLPNYQYSKRDLKIPSFLHKWRQVIRFAACFFEIGQSILLAWWFFQSWHSTPKRMNWGESRTAAIQTAHWSDIITHQVFEGRSFSYHQQNYYPPPRPLSELGLHFVTKKNLNSDLLQYTTLSFHSCSLHMSFQCFPNLSLLYNFLFRNSILSLNTENTRRMVLFDKQFLPTF